MISEAKQISRGKYPRINKDWVSKASGGSSNKSHHIKRLPRRSCDQLKFFSSGYGYNHY